MMIHRFGYIFKIIIFQIIIKLLLLNQTVSFGSCGILTQSSGEKNRNTNNLKLNYVYHCKKKNHNFIGASLVMKVS